MKPLLLFLFCALPIYAKPHLERIGETFKRPVHVTSLPNDANILFIVEQQGKVYLHNQAEGKTNPTPFLDISAQVSRKGNEEGLLGFAFDPNYQKNGFVYANFSNKKQTNEIVRFTVSEPAKAQVCDPGTKSILLTYKQPYRNHNGGYLDFGPDGSLYIGTGDGGAANDPKQNAQNLESLLGKILRINVSNDKGYTIPADNPFLNGKHPEILAYGIRNPWRCCWDGDNFYIADVGQNAWEEINIITAAELKGANFGWRDREATHKTPKKGVGRAKKDHFIEPVFEYPHGGKDDQGQSINGGYVYRGSVESLNGYYLFSDHVNPRIWGFKYENGKATKTKDFTDTLARPDGKKFERLSSFGQDAKKEVYILEFGGGSVWKIVE